MGGLDHYDSGDMIVDGISTHRYEGPRLGTLSATTASGSVFQSYNLIPHQTILQNVELALTLGRGEGRAHPPRQGGLASVG